MAFLRAALKLEVEHEVRARGLLLRPPAMADYDQWAELRSTSREHLVAFEPAWARDELARSAFRRRLRHYTRDLRNDQGYPFFLFRSADGLLLGGLTLSNVRRGVTQAASLGYWIGRSHAGHGHMTAAVAALTHFTFTNLRLHRIEAACLPNNAASIRVLEKNGFRREGLATDYLRINGHWQDHVLFALVESDPGGEVAR